MSERAQQYGSRTVKLIELLYQYNAKTDQSIHHTAHQGKNHRLKAESILLNALICCFCKAFWGRFSSPTTPPRPGPVRSEVLVEASRRVMGTLCDGVRSLIVSRPVASFGLRERCLRCGGVLKISPIGSGRCPRGNSNNSHGTPSMIFMFLGGPEYVWLYAEGEDC